MKLSDLSRRARTRLLALVDSDDAADEVRGMFGGRSGISLDVRVEPLAAVPERVGVLAPDILLVEVNDSADLAALERMSGALARLPVLVTSRKADLETAKRLMRLGIVDMLVRPLNPEDAQSALDAAILKASQNRKNAGSLGAVVAFLRSSGGAGSTTLAVETAFGLMGDKAARPTCLLDFDVQFGDAALSLDLDGPTGLLQILEAPERLDAAFLQGAMSQHQSGLHVLAAPPSIVPLDAMTADTAVSVLDHARELYDFIVIDMPHAWTTWTAPVLARADLVVLVTEINVTSLQRARRQLSLLQEQGLESAPLVVVANRFERGWSTRGALRQAESAIGHPIDHSVRTDQATVAAARDQGVPLRSIKKGNKVEKDLAPLVTEIRELRKAEPVLSVVA